MTEKYEYTIVVEAPSQALADLVVRERIYYDEPYVDDDGNAFEYQCWLVEPTKTFQYGRGR